MLDRVSALRERAEKGALALRDAPTEDVLAWARDELGAARLAVATSMQDAVLVDVVSRAMPGIDVVFLDTGYHFAETLGLRDAVASTYDIRLLTVLPALTVPEQDEELGPRLHDRDPDQCCRLRKVRPLDAVLDRYDGWITGLRRAETTARADTGPVEWDAKREMIKINPIVAWSDEEVDAYVEEHGVLVNLLRSDGYPSIGCAPCTARVAPGEDARAGRWQGRDKSECGLHE